MREMIIAALGTSVLTAIALLAASRRFRRQTVAVLAVAAGLAAIGAGLALLVTGELPRQDGRLPATTGLLVVAMSALFYFLSGSALIYLGARSVLKTKASDKAPDENR